MSKLRWSRRSFVKAGVAVAAPMVVPRHVLGKGFIPPSDRLVVAVIGAGGKGVDDISGIHKSGRADIGFLCDVDDRMAKGSVNQFPKALYYRDWRKLFDNHSHSFDAVCVSTPDHMHTPIALSAMQQGKHVYVQKPLSNNLYENRVLGVAAEKYRVVAQMGNQGASADGVRQLREWHDAGLIGDVKKVYSWTNKPVWPQGVALPALESPVPKGLDWDLWLGSAPWKGYVDKLVLGHPSEVEASAANIFGDMLKRVYAPEAVPAASYIRWKFPKTAKTKGELEYHWMDGGLQIPRPEEISPEEPFGNGSGTLFVGSKGKMFIASHGQGATLLPYSRMKEVHVEPVYSRVKDGILGHYSQWVNACIEGYGVSELSSPFDISSRVCEMLLLGALALQAREVRYPRPVDAPFIPGSDGYDYPARTTLKWDSEALRITNNEEANQFVKKAYREGWGLPRV